MKFSFLLKSAVAGLVSLALSSFLPAQASTLTVSNLADSGPGSLRDQVQVANFLSGADTIVFDAGLAGTIPLTSELDVISEITIRGPVASGVQISGGNTTRLFNVAAGAKLNLIYLTLRDGAFIGAAGKDGTDGVWWGDESNYQPKFDATAGQNGYGGAIYNAGALQVWNCLLVSNRTVGGKGGDGGDGGTTQYDAKVAGAEGGKNGGNASGGAIYNAGRASATLVNTTLAKNFITAGQGGIGGFRNINATIPNQAPNGKPGVEAGTAIGGDSISTLHLIQCTLNENKGSSADAIQNPTDYQLYNSLIGGAPDTTEYPSSSIGWSNAGNQGSYGGVRNELGPLSDHGGPTQTYSFLKTYHTSTLVSYGIASLLPTDPFDLDGDGDTNEVLPFDARGPGFKRVATAWLNPGSIQLPNYFLISNLKIVPSSNYGYYSSPLPIRVNDKIGFTYDIVFDSARQNDPLDTTVVWRIGDEVVKTISGPRFGSISTIDLSTIDQDVIGSTLSCEVTVTSPLTGVSDTIMSSTVLSEEGSLTVNTSSDTSTLTDGVTSLREAIAFANNGTEASSPVIQFDLNPHNNVIQLGSSLILNAGKVLVTISNPGEIPIIIQGKSEMGGDGKPTAAGDSFPLFASITNVSLEGLFFRYGRGSGAYFSDTGGGAVSVSNNALIRNCRFENNLAPGYGGALSARPYYMFQSTPPTVVVENCFFSKNSATMGGAIYSAANFFYPKPASTLSLSGCTFSQNTAKSFGGAVYFDGASMTANQCTFSGNNIVGPTPGTGGAVSSSSQSSFSNCTFVGNRSLGLGGAISQTNSTLTSGNNIFAGNMAGDNPQLGHVNVQNDSNVTTTLVDLGNNLIEVASGAVLPAPFTAPTDVVTTDAKVDALAYNGGPTPTIALLKGSPAFNAGNNALIPADNGDADGDSDLTEAAPFDQRGSGFPRVKANIVDIGAFESDLGGNESLVVTTLADEDNSTSNPATGSGTSLREALTYAEAHEGADTISFQAGLSGTIALQSALPQLTSDVTLEGPTASKVAISGQDARRIFEVGSSASLKLRYLTLKGGAAINGGAISTEGALLVEKCTLTGNNATNGGAIYVNASSSTASVVVRSSTITGNAALGAGGGIYNAKGNLTVEQSTVSGNSAPSGQGGGIANASGSELSTTVRGSIVAGNSTSNLDTLNGDANAFVSGGYNLIGVGDAIGKFVETGDKLLGTSSLGLASLSDNGGPTPTLALLQGSPAFNAGDPAYDGAGQTDQRGPGFNRIKLGRIDIGAFESTLDAPPVVVIGAPTQNQNLSIPAFKSITGTVTDNVGVSQVLIKLFRVRNGVTTYWNGTSFGTAGVQVPTTVTSPGALSSGWSFEVTPALRAALDLGPYLIAAYGKDGEGNISGAIGRNFTLVADTAAPAPVITAPSQNQSLPVASFKAISGTATDNIGVTDVLVKLFRVRNGVTTFWNGSSFGAAQVQLPAVVVSPGATVTAWSFPVTAELRAALDDGAYLVAVYAKDASNNLSGAVGRNFTLYSDTVAPSVVITSPTQNQTLPIPSFNTISGSASDNVGVAQVNIRLFRTRNGVTTYWNGTEFGASPVLLPVTLDAAGATSTSWNYPVSAELKAALDNGPYLLVAYAKDAIGNQNPAVGRNFNLTGSSTLKTAPPVQSVSGNSF